MQLAYLPLCVPSQSAIPSSHAGSWRQLEIGMLRWSIILVVLVISSYWPSQSWLAELKTAAGQFPCIILLSMLCVLWVKPWLWAIFQTLLIPAFHSQKRKSLWLKVRYFCKWDKHDYAFCLAEAEAASELHIQQMVFHRCSMLFVLKPLFQIFI